jgi:hypothetical protein
MADAVTSQTLSDGDTTAVMKFTNISDGSGEASVVKVDVSALTANSSTAAACSRVHITQVWYAISGMRIDLEWAATTNVKALILGAGVALEPTNGHFDFRSFGGIKNNAGSGIDGDVALTTLHHTSNDAYTIILELKKSY